MGINIKLTDGLVTGRKDSVRSDFLIHWSGKDIALDPLALTEANRSDYVDRLASILADGLWMTKPNERLKGSDRAIVKYSTPLTCFTEIRLSQTQSHSGRYGLLGIGVTRQFVLDRFGGPVHYVRNHAPECVVSNVHKIFTALNKHCAPEVADYFAVNISFIKNMSAPNKDDFTYLNEQEWRIVHTSAQTQAGKLVKTGLPQPEYRIPVKRDDVRIIVFPDEQTRIKARSDSRLHDWFQDSARPSTILLTVQECEHF